MGTAILASVPAPVLGLVIVGGSVALALLAMLAVRRSVAVEALREHQEVAGFIIAVIGVIYAVLLALVVIGVWEQYERGQEIAEQEAGAVADLYHLALALPARDRGGIQQHLRAYARAVIDDEWRLMQRGGASERAWDAFDDLWRDYSMLEPQTQREGAAYQESIQQLRALGDARGDRLLASRTAIPRVLWAVLIGGGILTIGFTYLFGVRRLAAQAVMVAALTASIALALQLILVLDFPFSGDMAISPEAFEQVLAAMDRLDGR
jgi:Protein of unknown function (DUF4239)